MHIGHRILILVGFAGLGGFIAFGGVRAIEDALIDVFERDRVFADAYNSTSSAALLPVRGRLIEEEPSDFNDPQGMPAEEFTQHEVKHSTVSVRLYMADKVVDLGDITTDSEGYFDTSIDISRHGLEPRRYVVEYRVNGTGVGKVRAMLLASDRDLPIVRSDVDLTYLDTNFQSTGAMAELLREPASAKAALPAMEVVFSRLRGDDVIPLTFLSGSPGFFKRVLELKMKIDGVDQDGLVLKPFKDIVKEKLPGLGIDELKRELKEQVGYKLSWLLRLRQQVPAATREILMGDDSEADYVVYAIYYRFMSGEWDEDRLLQELETLNVAEKWQHLVAREVKHVQTGAPPLAIYINKTAVAGDHYAIANWTIEGVTRHHAGGWPLALDLWEEGLLDEKGVRAVRARLLELGATPQVLREQAAVAFLKPATADKFSD